MSTMIYIYTHASTPTTNILNVYQQTSMCMSRFSHTHIYTHLHSPIYLRLRTYIHMEVNNGKESNSMEKN